MTCCIRLTDGELITIQRTRHRLYFGDVLTVPPHGDERVLSGTHTLTKNKLPLVGYDPETLKQENIRFKLLTCKFRMNNYPLLSLHDARVPGEKKEKKTIKKGRYLVLKGPPSSFAHFLGSALLIFNNYVNFLPVAQEGTCLGQTTICMAINITIIVRFPLATF